MRGINKLCLTLIVMLMISAFAGVGSVTASDTMVWVNPPVIHNEDLAIESFTVTIEVTNVVDLWGFGFTLKFEPLMRVIHPVEGGTNEGTFLDAFATRPVEEDRISFFTYSSEVTQGALHVGCTLLNKVDPYTGDPVPSASGSGILASVTFLVMEAGSSLIELEDTKLIDSNNNLIPHETGKGHYFGPYADQNHVGVSDPKVNVGETVSFEGDARNFGNVPLYTRIRYDLIREDMLYTFYSGRQSLYAQEPYYIGWGTVGTAPYLTAVDGNYLEETWTCPMVGYPDYDWGIEFDDMAPLEPGQDILAVSIDLYCWTDEADTDIDMDIYVWLPSYGISWVYLGAIEPFTAWSWVSLDLIGPVSEETYPGSGIYKPSRDRINDVEILIHFWRPDAGGTYLGRIDAVKLTVDVVPKLQPKEKYTFDPYVLGPFDTADVGKYYGTATCWFSNGGTWWNPAHPQRTFKFEVQN